MSVRGLCERFPYPPDSSWVWTMSCAVSSVCRGAAAPRPAGAAETGCLLSGPEINDLGDSNPRHVLAPGNRLAIDGRWVRQC